jgi:hypothetical protein
MAAGAVLWIAALMALVVAGLRSGHSHSWPQISLAVGAGLWIAVLMVIREYGRRCWRVNRQDCRQVWPLDRWPAVWQIMPIAGRVGDRVCKPPFRDLQNCHLTT